MERAERGEKVPLEKDEGIAKLHKEYESAKVHPDEIPLDELHKHAKLRAKFNMSLSKFDWDKDDEEVKGEDATS